MFCWLANSLSCISQNFPCAWAATAASAASGASAWKGSGLCRKITRTLFPYSFSIWWSVGTTRLQNGHWKSENSTTVTFASAGPFAAPSSGTRTRSTPSPAPCGSFIAIDDFAVAALAPPPLPFVSILPMPIPPPSTTTNRAKTVPLFMTISVRFTTRPRENTNQTHAGTRPTRTRAKLSRPAG